MIVLHFVLCWFHPLAGKKRSVLEVKCALVQMGKLQVNGKQAIGARGVGASARRESKVPCRFC